MANVFVLALGFALVATSTFAQEIPSKPPLPELTGTVDRVTPGENWLTECVQIHTLDRAEVIEALVQKGVRVDDPDEAIDISFLHFLRSYLSLIPWQGPRTLVLVPWKSDGPQRVRTQIAGAEHRLLVGPNAAKDLFGVRLRNELLDRKKQGKPTVGTEVEITFNNSLFEQLTREIGTPETISNAIHEQFGLQTISQAEQMSRAMNKSEAALVLKQLIDLPTPLIKGASQALTHIVRMQNGVVSDSGPQVMAEYDRINRTIRLYDPMFKNKGNSQGIKSSETGTEGTLIHELGHALWETMSDELRREFFVLSWKNPTDGRDKPVAAHNRFVSGYSMKNPEEDFAEHFSAFVDRSEWMALSAPEKALFFKTHFFKNTSFFTSAHEKARLDVSSDAPDVLGPTLEGSIREILSLSAEINPKAEDEIQFKCEIKSGLKDDISGFKKAYLTITSKNKTGMDGWDSRWSLELEPKDCVDCNLGHFRNQVSIPRKQFWDDTYEITSIQLDDKAGNTTYVPIEEMIALKIPGTKTKQDEPKVEMPVFDDSKIRVAPLGQKDELGNDIFEISIPTPHLAKFDEVRAFFWLPENGSNLDFRAVGPREVALEPAYSEVLGVKVKVPDWVTKKLHQAIFGNSGTKNTFLSNVGDPETKFQVVVDRRLLPQNAELKSLVFSTKDKTSATESRMLNAKKDLTAGLPNLIVPIRPSQADKTAPDLVVNELAFTVQSSETLNSLGGTHVLLIELPVSGIETDTDKALLANVIVRLPSGRSLSVNAEIKKGDDPTKIRFRLELPPNHERGTYTIDSFWATEGTPFILSLFPPESKNPKWIKGTPTFYSKSIRVLDRMIRKTVLIE